MFENDKAENMNNKGNLQIKKMKSEAFETNLKKSYKDDFRSTKHKSIETNDKTTFKSSYVHKKLCTKSFGMLKNSICSFDSPIKKKNIRLTDHYLIKIQTDLNKAWKKKKTEKMRSLYLNYYKIINFY